MQLAEEAFAAELSKLVGHLAERLTAGVDGEKKVFRDSAVTNLTEFFTRFKSLNVRSNAELDQLVETAERVLGGTDPAAVRNRPADRDAAIRGLGIARRPAGRPAAAEDPSAGPDGGSVMTPVQRSVELVVDPGGTTRSVYNEAIDLTCLGQVRINRASSVEPDEQGRWWADLSPVPGPKLGPFDLRSVALAAELAWLEEHLLARR